MPYVLELRQRITPLQNRYDLVGFHGGTEQTLAYAEQKRMSLKEKITFFSDQTKAQVAFRVGARSMVELAATYDVEAADGTQLATMKKSFASSLLRSTYEVATADGRQLTCQERSIFRALLRRVTDMIPLPIQFDVIDRGHVLATIDRQMKLRDVYRAQVNDDAFDWRVAAAITVAIDAFMNR